MSRGSRVLTDAELDIQADAGSNVPEMGPGGSITDDEKGKFPPTQKKKKKHKVKGSKKNAFKMGPDSIGGNGLAVAMNPKH